MNRDSLALLFFFLQVMWPEFSSISAESCHRLPGLVLSEVATEIPQEMTETELSPLPVRPSAAICCLFGLRLARSPNWNLIWFLGTRVLDHLGPSWHSDHSEFTWIKWIGSDSSASFSDWCASWVPSTHNVHILMIAFFMSWLNTCSLMSLMHFFTILFTKSRLLGSCRESWPDALEVCFSDKSCWFSLMIVLSYYLLYSKRFWRLVNTYICFDGWSQYLWEIAPQSSCTDLLGARCSWLGEWTLDSLFWNIKGFHSWHLCVLSLPRLP